MIDLSKYEGWFGTTKSHDDAKKAEGGLSKVSGAYDGMEAPKLDKMRVQGVTPQQAQAQSAGPSAMAGISVDPAGQEAQRAQLAALSNLAKNGGRNAASDANLAQIQQSANANAQGQRGAIMQNAQARGMGGSGNSLLAQLSASQNATNNQSAQDMMVRGQDQNNALQAGMGAAQIGSNMENQQFSEQAQKAAAADAIAKFNAGNNTQNSQFNVGQANNTAEANAGRDMQAQGYNTGLAQTDFEDRMGITKGKQSGAQYDSDYWAKKYAEDQKASGAMIGGAAKGAMAMFASRGGQVPGVASVHGDSLANDTVPVHTSPGEVIVPRSLARSGDSSKIASFVKHPPPIAGSKDKEAMLSALKSLRSRR